MSFITEEQLRFALMQMKPGSRAFELVKAEMKRRGHWKNLPRGKVFQKGQDERRKPLEGGKRSESDN